MSDRNLPPISDAFAYWSRGKLQVVLHGREPGDDRVGELTAVQAIKLAETLIRAAREAMAQ